MVKDLGIGQQEGQVIGESRFARTRVAHQGQQLALTVAELFEIDRQSVGQANLQLSGLAVQMQLRRLGAAKAQQGLQGIEHHPRYGFIQA